MATLVVKRETGIIENTGYNHYHCLYEEFFHICLGEKKVTYATLPLLCIVPMSHKTTMVLLLNVMKCISCMVLFHFKLQYFVLPSRSPSDLQNCEICIFVFISDSGTSVNFYKRWMLIPCQPKIPGSISFIWLLHADMPSTTEVYFEF